MSGKLPRVSPETIEAVQEAIEDAGPNLMPFLMAQLQAIDKENPLVADQIRQWIKATGIPEFEALLGAVTIYSLLRSQATSDALQHSWRLN
jgi:hypothetical protein